MYKSIIAIIVVILIALGLWYFFTHHAPAPPQTAATPLATATFACDGGTNLTAAFYAGSSTPPTGANQPPTPSGSVALTLANGQTLTLAQTVSADGGRYASADGSTLFWEKGNGAMWTPGAKQPTIDCVEVMSDSGGLSNVYASSTEGFSLRYPSNFTANDAYVYQELGPGKSISGVSFTIDPAIAKGTNLDADTYISVEHLPNTAGQSCTADRFLDGASAPTTVTDGQTTYSFASTTGAGAGNRYEETVYAIPGTSPCTAVRYYIHYSVIENYPPGTVTAYDEQSLLAQFDQIRRTLTIDQ